MWERVEMRAPGRCQMNRIWASAPGSRLWESLAVLVAFALLCCVVGGCGSRGRGIAGRYVRDGYPGFYLVIREDGTWTSRGWSETVAKEERYLRETTGTWERDGDEIYFMVDGYHGSREDVVRPHEVRGNKIVLDLWGMLEDVVWVKQ